MAESAAIAELSHKHVAICDYMVLNPELRKTDVARHFGVSLSWLSIIIRSDAFRDMMAKRQDEHFSRASLSLAEKLEAVADLALDKLAESLEVEVDTKEIRETAAMALDKLGYGGRGASPAAPSNVQNNFMLVNPEDLAAARSRILEKMNGTPSLPSPAAQLPASGDRPVGGHLIDGTAVRSGEPLLGQAGGGEAV